MLLKAPAGSSESSAHGHGELVMVSTGVGRDGDPFPQVTSLEDEHTPLHPLPLLCL